MFVSSPLAVTLQTCPRECVPWVCSDLDCMLSAVAWDLVERSFGPHSFDLMSLDSNCRRDRYGRLLPHYSPWPTPASQGINAFSQPIPLGHNIYVFPPFVLVGPLLRYFIDQGFRGAFTLVVPDLRPKRVLVGSPLGCCSRSSLARQERRRNRSAFPFSRCARLVITQPSVGLMGLPLCFLNFPCSPSRFYDPGSRLVVVVLVYIQMIRTLTFAKRVGLSPRLLNQLYSWGEVLWMRRQSWNASKVSSRRLATNPISARSRLWSSGFPRSSHRFSRRRRLFRHAR